MTLLPCWWLLTSSARLSLVSSFDQIRLELRVALSLKFETFNSMALWTCFNTLLASKRLDGRWCSKDQLISRTCLASTPTNALSPLVNTASLSWLDLLLDGAREKSNKDLKFCLLLRMWTVRFNNSMPLRPLDCFLVLVAVFSCPCRRLPFLLRLSLATSRAAASFVLRKWRLVE